MEWIPIKKRNSKIEFFAKKANSWKLLTIFAKSFILYLWEGSEYDSSTESMSTKILKDILWITKIFNLHENFSLFWFV